MDTPILFLDLDWTVRLSKDQMWKFVKTAEDVKLFDWVKNILKKYKDKWYRIVAVTNQWWVASWHLTKEELNSNLIETDRQTWRAFDIMKACTEPVYSNAHCRKPNTWMLESAIDELLGIHKSETYPKRTYAYGLRFRRRQMSS